MQAKLSEARQAGAQSEAERMQLRLALHGSKVGWMGRIRWVRYEWAVADHSGGSGLGWMG